MTIREFIEWARREGFFPVDEGMSSIDLYGNPQDLLPVISLSKEYIVSTDEKTIRDFIDPEKTLHGGEKQ